MNMYRLTGGGLLAFVMVVSVNVACAQAQAQKGVSKMTVSEGKLVSLEYTLRLDDKTVVESNVGGDPLKYTQGAHELIVGLEKALEGMAVGDKKTVTVPPADGYGAVDPKAFQEVSKKLIPPDALKVGAQLQGRGPDGRVLYPRVSEVKDETGVLDFNHPLAGKTLVFDVKVLDIKDGAVPSNPKRPH